MDREKEHPFDYHLRMTNLAAKKAHEATAQGQHNEAHKWHLKVLHHIGEARKHKPPTIPPSIASELAKMAHNSKMHTASAKTSTLQHAHRIVNDHASDIHGGDSHSDVSKRRFTRYQLRAGDLENAMHELKTAGFKTATNHAPRAKHHLVNGRTHVLISHPEGRHETHIVNVQHASVDSSENSNMALSAQALANLKSMNETAREDHEDHEPYGMENKPRPKKTTATTESPAELAAYGTYRGYHPHRALHDEARHLLESRGHHASHSSDRLGALSGVRGMRVQHQVGSTATKLPRPEQHAEHMAATQELHKLVQKHGFQHTSGGTYHHPETGAKVHIHTPHVGKTGDSYLDHFDNHTNMSITHSLSKRKATAGMEEEVALFSKGPKFGKNWKDHESVDDHNHHMRHAGKHLAEYNKYAAKVNEARAAGRGDEANKLAERAQRHLGWNRNHLARARKIYHKSMAAFEAEIASLTVEAATGSQKAADARADARRMEKFHGYHRRANDAHSKLGLPGDHAHAHRSASKDYGTALLNHVGVHAPGTIDSSPGEHKVGTHRHIKGSSASHISLHSVHNKLTDLGYEHKGKVNHDDKELEHHEYHHPEHKFTVSLYKRSTHDGGKAHHSVGAIVHHAPNGYEHHAKGLTATKPTT